MLSEKFLNDIDFIIRSCVKEMLLLPFATNNNMVYCSKKYRGLSIVKTGWEAFLQNFNICTKLSVCNEPYLVSCRDLEREMDICIRKLNLSNEECVEQR